MQLKNKKTNLPFNEKEMEASLKILIERGIGRFDYTYYAIYRYVWHLNWCFKNSILSVILGNLHYNWIEISGFAIHNGYLEANL